MIDINNNEFPRKRTKPVRHDVIPTSVNLTGFFCFLRDIIMAKDPAVLFYFQDFLVGTSLMSDEEIGKYIKILCHLADKGTLTKKHMLSICNAQTLPDFVKEKFKVDEQGNFYNQRMRDEKEKRSKYTESRRNNALGEKAYAKHMEDVNENTNENVIDLKEQRQSILINWNNFAKQNNLSAIIKLTSKRESGINSRLSENEFDLEKIFNEIKQSDFLKGSTGWKVDFDFVFCSTNNYLKILEGKYRNNGTTQLPVRQSEQIARATFRHTPEQLEANRELAKSIGLLRSKRS